MEWILSYLKKRKIIVSLRGENSEEEELDIGVGQVSIVGPLFFLLFINDLPFFLQTNDIVMYADDTALIIHEKRQEELEQKTQQIIDHFSEWCRKISCY